MPDEDFLLALLNSTPVIDGVPPTPWPTPPGPGPGWPAPAARAPTRSWPACGRSARPSRRSCAGEQPPAVLGPALDGAACAPAIAGGQVSWTLSVAPERELAVRAVLAWDALARNHPGRLRPCANDECRLFLIDRTRAGTARWCSMAACGNRMKARRHYQRARSAP